MRKGTIVVFFLFIGLFILIGCKNNSVDQPEKVVQNPKAEKKEIINLDSQLALFQELGFKFNLGTSKQDIVYSWGEEMFNKKQHELLYITLGSTIEKEPWTFITDQAWHFDQQAISNKGDYANIIKNFKRLSNGELNFTNISDVVDWTNKKTSVSFQLNGDKYHWDFNERKYIDDDFVNPNIYFKIVELTKKYKTKGKFTCFDTGGTDPVFGYSTPEKLEEIKKKTGLNIVWLENARL